MEVIDLGLSDLEPISIKIDDAPSFGGGIELLMNDKKKAPTGSMNIDLGELDKLENELNNLSSSASNSDTKSLGGLGNSFSNFFGLGGGDSSGTKKVNISEPSSNSQEPSLGQSTADSMGNTKTWDGFSKINEIPQSGPSGGSSRMSDREQRRKKRMMIKKIEEWYEKGLIKSNPHFTQDSPYDEVEDEYETALEDKRKKDSIKLQGWWFMTAVNSLEYANAAFNPFDINLDGWGEQVNEDIDSYEEIFAELHDKYKGGKLAPELSLLLRLGFSAAVVNFTNKALSSATPAFNDVIKQSPELMKMFTNATVSSMSQASPGFAMANNLMKDSQGPPMNMGPPPAPVETKAMPNMGQRPGNNTQNFQQVPQNRPDLAMGRGASVTQLAPPPAPVSGRSEPVGQRQEMRGPSTDIDSILQGLKTKVPEQNIFQPQQQQQPQDITTEYGMDSMISATSLTDMQNGSIPKSSRRRRANNNSRGNTISLDI
jgi:hypothetical protein